MWLVFRLGSGSEILIRQQGCLPHSACFVGRQEREAEMRTVEEKAGAFRFLLLPTVIQPGLLATVFVAVVAARMPLFELVGRGRGQAHCYLSALVLAATV